MPFSKGMREMAPKNVESGYGLAFESSGAIAELLKSASHPSRVQILAVALRGEGDFGHMMRLTNLSKTALANHLAQLVDNGLMRRLSRGKYGLTPDGRQLLSAAFSTYRSSAKRVANEKELVRQSYSRAFGGASKADKAEISSPATYQPCWLSLLGSVAGSLTALGRSRTVVDVGGYSGYSFLINVSRGETCPSGPTALHIKTFLRVLDAIQSLGWRIQNFEYPHSYPGGPGGPTPEELGVVKGLFERIRKEVDRHDRPVVLYGLAAPEYGIVRGYEGESYLVSTFRSLQNPGVPEEPVPYQDLNAPGCVDALFFQEKVNVNPSRARKDALARALEFAEGDVDMQKNYVSGPPALEEWARVLEEIPQEAQNYMGNSYVGACVQEGRYISSEFLKGLSKKVPVGQSRHLRKASVRYSNGAHALAGFTKLFPFRFEGKMPAAKRRRGAAMLREAMSHEEKAIQYLRRVA